MPPGRTKDATPQATFCVWARTLPRSSTCPIMCSASPPNCTSTTQATLFPSFRPLSALLAPLPQFHTPEDALRFAVTLQAGLMTADWSEALLGHPSAAPVFMLPAAGASQLGVGSSAFSFSEALNAHQAANPIFGKRSSSQLGGTPTTSSAPTTTTLRLNTSDPERAELRLVLSSNGRLAEHHECSAHRGESSPTSPAPKLNRGRAGQASWQARDSAVFLRASATFDPSDRDLAQRATDTLGALLASADALALLAQPRTTMQSLLASLWGVQAASGGLASKHGKLLACEDAKPQLAFRGMRVRIGMHTGVGDQHVERDETTGRTCFVGPPMDITKAIADAGSGGMVLLSRSSFERMANVSVPREVLLLSVGEVMLTDGNSSVCLYQAIERPLLMRLATFGALRRVTPNQVWRVAGSPSSLGSNPGLRV
eukprot:361758-Chlamydomonas_euryale.AAC.12